ncbi:MAG: hypothetical protein LBC56_00225, partial [Oscillospiraceae bacterium]|nr:hypothetical protein [Oscillospiraceae bacterium]
PEDYGEFAYIMANAVKPDITVRSLYYSKHIKECLSNDMLMCRYRFNSEAEYYNISNTKLIVPQENFSELQYLSLGADDSELIDFKAKGCCVFNSLNPESAELVYNSILNKLASFKSIV